MSTASKTLLLVPRGSRLTPSLVGFLREKGYEPFVLSTATGDGGAAFGQVCADLQVEHAITPTVSLSAEQVLQQVAKVPGAAFCFTVADGLRYAMAVANEAIGAHDVSPLAVLHALDKHLMRGRLVEHRLSRLTPLRLSDPELLARLDRGERHIVKPRRGAASLCTRAVTSWHEVAEQVAEFERGTDAEDQWGEFYRDNELVAETFFDGDELSFEILRQNGRTVLAVEHEKPSLEFTDRTVLEHAFTAPAVWLPAEHVNAARALTDAALDTLELHSGCFHVEVRVDGSGSCELVEINPRVGGGFLYESVLVQLGRSLGHEWVDVLVGTPVPTFDGDRRCGTYLQNLYPEPGRQVIGMVLDPELPAPAKFSKIFRRGQVGRPDRADRAAAAMWQTELADHRDTATKLVDHPCVSFVYAKGLRGRPLLLVFELAGDAVQVIERADRDGLDAVLLHSEELPDPLPPGLETVAATREVGPWHDGDALLRILDEFAEHEVAGTFCDFEPAQGSHRLARERFGLAASHVRA